MRRRFGVEITLEVNSTNCSVTGMMLCSTIGWSKIYLRQLEVGVIQ